MLTHYILLTVKIMLSCCRHCYYNAGFLDGSVIQILYLLICLSFSTFSPQESDVSKQFFYQKKNKFKINGFSSTSVIKVVWFFFSSQGILAEEIQLFFDAFDAMVQYYINTSLKPTEVSQTLFIKIFFQYNLLKFNLVVQFCFRKLLLLWLIFGWDKFI